jgi:hypothetical protein
MLCWRMDGPHDLGGRMNSGPVFIEPNEPVFHERWEGINGPEIEYQQVVENSPTVHNVVVCTLCSCYPWGVLGLPPNWYKDPPYRSRMVREPRVLLAEMECPIGDAVEIQVWDSSADTLPGAARAAPRHRETDRRAAPASPFGPGTSYPLSALSLPKYSRMITRSRFASGRPQSRWSSQASPRTEIGVAPAWIMRCIADS